MFKTIINSAINTVLAQFSINKLNRFDDIEYVLQTLENQCSQLTSNWYKTERANLMTVYKWLDEHDYEVDDVTEDLKDIAKKIEDDVKKNLIGSITVDQLAELAGLKKTEPCVTADCGDLIGLPKISETQTQPTLAGLSQMLFGMIGKC